MASEEGVDHQEAHFRPALLLRGIPADRDPASEGRAVLTAKACAGFLLNASFDRIGIMLHDAQPHWGNTRWADDAFYMDMEYE